MQSACPSQVKTCNESLWASIGNTCQRCPAVLVDVNVPGTKTWARHEMSNQAQCHGCCFPPILNRFTNGNTHSLGREPGRADEQRRVNFKKRKPKACRGSWVFELCSWRSLRCLALSLRVWGLRLGFLHSGFGMALCTPSLQEP